MIEADRIESVFTHALQQPTPQERANYLDQACAADPVLRNRVEALLRAYDLAGSFLEPATPVVPVDPATVEPDESAGLDRARALPLLADIPPEVWGEQIERACGGDGEPQRAVNRLAQVHRESDSPSTTPSAQPSRATIGPYKLLQQLGEGGMGTVWMAEQTSPVRRMVALKLIKSGIDSGQVVARFEAERQALALMDHPNIARVLDADTTEEGQPYFVMELVKGVPITQFCDDNQLKPDERLRLFVSVCSAVQHAHQKGIIHRDLKPSNVLVALYDGKAVPKVIDFGVAKAAGQRLTDKTLFTGFGAVVGTPEYMSPEQAELNQLDIDTRSDIYSLGVLLYELLTGSTPVTRQRARQAALLEVLRVIREEDVPRPSARLSTTEELPRIAARRSTEPARLSQMLRGEVDWIVMKALEKDRNRRYETANGFAADVQRYLADEPVLACPPSAGYRFRKFARRNKAALAVATAVAAAVLLAVGSLASALVVMKGEQDQTREALGREKEANDELVRTRAVAIADASRGLWGETKALRLARPAGWRETALDNLRRLALIDTPERDFVELRSEAVACLAELDAREVLRLGGHTETVYGVAFSPDGKTLASAGYDGHTFLWDVAEGRLLRQVADPRASATGFWSSRAPLPMVRFRPGGGCLAYTTWNRRVEFLGWGERPVALPAVEGPAQPRDLAFDRRGQVLAVSWGNGQVGIYDATTGSFRRLIHAQTPQVGFYMPIALHPAGDLFAARGPGETIRLHTVDPGGDPEVVGQHRSVVRALAFSPDGKTLASASEDHTARLWDVKRGKERLTLHGHTSKVVCLAFSPDGELLATGGHDETLRLWEVRTGRLLLVIRPGWPPEAVAFSPDGRRLAAGFRAVAVYELADRLGRQLPRPGFLTTALAMHPSKPILAAASRNPILAAASRNNEVSLWDLATGKERRPFRGLPGVVGNLAFSPDGRLLVAAPFARFNSTYFLSGDVSVLDMETGKVRKRFSGAYSAAVAFDPSGRRLALGSQDGFVSVHDVPSEKVIHHFQPTKGWISELAFLTGGSRLLVAELGGALRVCDVASGRTLRHKKMLRGLLRFAVNPVTGQVAAADLSGQIRILSLPDLEVLATLEPPGEPRWLAVAFSTDGRWLAVGGANRQVTLYDARTFRKVLRLPAQNSLITEVAFQPGTSRFVVGGLDELLTVWDLDLIEPALAAVGLGMERLPDESARTAEVVSPLPLIRGQPITGAPLPLIEWLIWLAERVLETNPDQADVSMELAWIWVMGPKKFRDPARALEPARRAVELAPGDPLCLNTLGVVYYRLGRWKEALQTLQAAARANREGPTAYDLFFQSMSYHQLGQAQKARDCFDRAERWRTRARLVPHQVAELHAIAAEATQTLTSPVKRE